MYWRDAERRSDQAEPSRLRHHRPRQREHLLLAAAQRPGGLRRALLEAREHGEHPVHQRADAGGFAAELEPAHLEILSHGEEGEAPPPFGDERDPEPRALPGGKTRDVAALEPDGAGARREHPGHGPQGRGLPGPVRADERDDLALVDAEAQGVAGPRPPVGQPESPRPPQGGFGTRSPREAPPTGGVSLTSARA